MKYNFVEHLTGKKNSNKNIFQLSVYKIGILCWVY